MGSIIFHKSGKQTMNHLESNLVCAPFSFIFIWQLHGAMAQQSVVQHGF